LRMRTLPSLPAFPSLPVPTLRTVPGRFRACCAPGRRRKRGQGSSPTGTFGEPPSFSALRRQPSVSSGPLAPCAVNSRSADVLMRRSKRRYLPERSGIPPRKCSISPKVSVPGDPSDLPPGLRFPADVTGVTDVAPSSPSATTRGNRGHVPMKVTLQDRRTGRVRRL